MADQSAISANAGFDDSGPPAAELCGFKLPFAFFGFAFELPPITFPPAFPRFGVALGLNCSLDNPINVSASLPYGGGRIGTSDPDGDDAFDQAT